MKDWEQEVLSQYDIDVQNKRKVRSGILCEGESGTFLMAQTRLSETRLSMLEQLEMHLLDSGIADVDHLVRNKEGELYCELEDETRCIVKTWFAGRECDVKKENELLNATKNLTRIHKALRRPVSWKEPEAKAHQGEDLNQIFFRHNRELKKVRTFARERVDKGVFEQEFLKNFDSMYIWAEAAAEKLKGSSYKNLERHLIHGDYNYHNILMLYDGVATTNFEHFEENIQMTDFYYFLRKAMEKHQWDSRLGDKMIDYYQRFLSFTKEEMEYLSVLIAYPEKFWKAANSYSRSKKAWIPAKSLEKMELVISQIEKKKKFLEDVFGFHL